MSCEATSRPCSAATGRPASGSSRGDVARPEGRTGGSAEPAAARPLDLGLLVRRHVLDGDAFPVGDPQVSFYAGRVLHHRGAWWLFAWRHVDGRGQFFGELSDPMPLTVDAAGSLWVEDRPEGGDAGAGSA